VRNVRSGQVVPVAVSGSPRALAGRRVKAARLLAGGVSVRDAATATGMSYQHLVAVEHGEQPLLPTDATDLGRVLGCPSEWLAHGWSGNGAAT